MVTAPHAPIRLTILPVPRSARDVPPPSDAALAWIIDDTHRLAAVDRHGTLAPRPLPDGRAALDAAFGADGTLWVLAGDPPGGAGEPAVLRYPPAAAAGTDTDTTGDAVPAVVPTPVPATRLAAGPDGTLWLIGQAGEVLSVAPDGRARRHSPPGEPFAEEISAGVDGSVWVVSTTTRYAGRIVKRLPDPDGEWFDLPAPASATRLAVAPDGMAWTLNSRGEVWRLHPLGGGSLAECQVDTACSECRFSAGHHRMAEIGVSPDGTVWAIGTDGDGGEPGLYRLADPARRAYETVATPRTPRRVAGGLRGPSASRP